MRWRIFGCAPHPGIDLNVRVAFWQELTATVRHVRSTVDLPMVIAGDANVRHPYFSLDRSRSVDSSVVLIGHTKFGQDVLPSLAKPSLARKVFGGQGSLGRGLSGAGEGGPGDGVRSGVEAPKGWGPEGVGGQKNLLFSSLSRHNFLSSLSWGCFCEAAGVSHDSPRAQTCTFGVPALQNTTKIPPPKRGKKE